MAVGKHSAPEDNITYGEDSVFDEKTERQFKHLSRAQQEDDLPDGIPELDDGGWDYETESGYDDGGAEGDYFGGAGDEYDEDYPEEEEKEGIIGSLLTRLFRGKKEKAEDAYRDDYDREETPEDEYSYDDAYDDAGGYDAYAEAPLEDYGDEAYAGYEDVPVNDYSSRYEELTQGGYDDETEDAWQDGEFAAEEAPYDDAYDAYGNPLYDDGQGGYDSDYDAYGESGKSGTLAYILAAASGVVAVIAIVFALLTLFGGKTAKTEGTAETRTEQNVQETAAAAANTEVIYPQQTSESVATPEPGGSVALLKDGVIVPGERGSVVPERDELLSLDAFSGTTMIGNSFVEGMQLWSDINKCDYVCADGVSLDNMIGNYLYFVTVRPYTSIYLTLGLNEIGWPVDSFISKYEKVIDYIRSDAYSPNATIYITSVFPVEEVMETTAAESGSTISLETILLFNERLKEMCERKGCWYLDVYSALANDRGYLPADVAADDHVHFEKTGYRIWTDYLRNHYVDESLVEA